MGHEDYTEVCLSRVIHNLMESRCITIINDKTNGVSYLRRFKYFANYMTNYPKMMVGLLITVKRAQHSIYECGSAAYIEI